MNPREVIKEVLSDAERTAPYTPVHVEVEGEPAPLLKPVDVAGVLSNPSPPPAFVWDGYCPRGEVTLWGAHGGTGKSTINLMLSAAAALGQPLFGVPTTRCPVVFVSLEDGAHVVRHRLAHICRAWGIDPLALIDLHVVDGTAAPELFTAEARGAGETTAAHAELASLVQSVGAGLVVVDNASDAFGGDEINRRQVRAFIRSLAKIARDADAAVLLLAHVDKGTSRNVKPENGEGYSGSTAWHNSVRSRLFMSRASDGVLTLEHQKSNHGRKLEPLELHWPDGGLPESAGAPATRELMQRAQARADDAAAAALLRLLVEFESRGQYASPNLTARNGPHALLRNEPTFKALGLTRNDVQRLVNQCQRAGWIETATYRTTDRKERDRWAVTEQGRSFAGLVALTAPTAPTYTADEVGAEGAGWVRPPRPHPRGVRGVSARAEDGANLSSGGAI